MQIFGGKAQYLSDQRGYGSRPHCGDFIDSAKVFDIR
jgi:hypothetical protein